MAAIIQRHAFSDFLGLELLGQGVVPAIEETKRRIFIAERRFDTLRPDHFYKGYLEHRIGRVEEVGKLPQVVLTWLAERYLERSCGEVRVRSHAFVEWQELLPFLSPLAVIVAFLVAEDRDLEPQRDPRSRLKRELGDTALIGAVDLALDDLIARNGLHETHMHLNGSTELDVLWPSACARPDDYYASLEDARSGNEGAVDELYEQIEPGLRPVTVFRRLRAARRVRRLVSARINHVWHGAPEGEWPSRSDLLEAMQSARSDAECRFVCSSAWSDAPASLIYGGARVSSDRFSPLINEAAFLYACLRFIEQRPDDPVVGLGLYFNLLVQRQIARISVQQADQAGFDQFQKHTIVGIRDFEERSQYSARLRQINIKPPYRVLAHLEGRFAPKASPQETGALVTKIVRDYLKFRGCGMARDGRFVGSDLPACLREAKCETCGCNPGNRAEAGLVLTAHFIKQKRSIDADVKAQCRDVVLRRKLEVQARALSRLVEDSRVAETLIVGVDAAANELHASPEPFAAAFRIARRAGIPHATFHAGEDFLHLVMGIRAVAEAVEFAGLRSGDRIGHATALGIRPGLWLDRAAERTMMPRHDRLDDAVFAHEILSSIKGFEADVQGLVGTIALDSEKLYSTPQSPTLLQEAWKLRQLDHLRVREIEAELERRGEQVRSDAVSRLGMLLAERTLDPVIRAEYELTSKVLESAPSASYDLYRRRHRLSRSLQEELIEVDSRILREEALSALQDYVLGLLNRLDIAIETLPTSNIRISYYENMAEHHLFRWMGLVEPKLKNQPTVVVGSDDPGIFSTNLKNEFALVTFTLRRSFGLSAVDAAVMVERLVKMGRMRRFRPKLLTL